MAVTNCMEADVLLLSPQRAGQAEAAGALVVKGETGDVLQLVSSYTNKRTYTPPKEAAVIFMSSGSTWLPKGVMLRDDRVLLSQSLGCSSAVTGEWLLALHAGANLQMVRYVRDYGATFLSTVPSTLIPLLKSKKWLVDDLATLRPLGHRPGRDVPGPVGRAENEEVQTDLGLRMLDIGYLDHEGYLYVTGRACNDQLIRQSVPMYGKMVKKTI